MDKIKVAVVGLGNCASSLVQGISYYAGTSPDGAVGLMHWDIGGYKPFDIEVAAAFDIDRRKVGRDVSEAIFAPPNCTRAFCPEVPRTGVQVAMGRILDGYPAHMDEYPEESAFRPAREREPEKGEVVRHLREAGAHVLVNYLPVGAERATRFYAECALEAGMGLLNCIPVFIASDPQWADRYRSRGVPVVGDDIKSQVGATIVHRALAELFRSRGVPLQRTYQLNIGGNTDFLNMLSLSRLSSKRVSKTEAVQSAAPKRMQEGDIHVGPSDYVSWLGDGKTAYIRMEGKLFGGVDMSLDLKLCVEDSPNSAGIAIDAVRCIKLALERGEAGPLTGPCSFFMKHPPEQHEDEEARRRTETFIAGREA
jgi:myo-inositol-1-phosphate synthase